MASKDTFICAGQREAYANSRDETVGKSFLKNRSLQKNRCQPTMVDIYFL